MSYRRVIVWVKNIGESPTVSVAPSPRHPSPWSRVLSRVRAHVMSNVYPIGRYQVRVRRGQGREDRYGSGT